LIFPPGRPPLGPFCEFIGFDPFWLLFVPLFGPFGPLELPLLGPPLPFGALLGPGPFGLKLLGPGPPPFGPKGGGGPPIEFSGFIGFLRSPLVFIGVFIMLGDGGIIPILVPIGPPIGLL